MHVYKVYGNYDTWILGKKANTCTMSSNSEGKLVMAADNSLDIDEEELLDYSCSSDCDDVLSLGMSDAGDLLDDDTLYESVGHLSKPQQVLKPSQRNPITAPKVQKLSHITPITAPDIPSTCTSLSLPSTTLMPPANKVGKTVSSKILKTTRITCRPSQTFRKRLVCGTTLQRRSPIGIPVGEKVSKPFQSSPIKPPENSHRAINTTKRSSRVLPRMNGIGEDFVSTDSTTSSVVASDSEESSDDQPCYYSRYYDAGIRDSESCDYKDQSGQESCYTVEPSFSLVKVDILSTSSSNSEANPFVVASLTNDESPSSFGGVRETRKVTSQKQCSSMDTSLSVGAASLGKGSPGNPFHFQRESVGFSPVEQTTQRKVDYCESNASAVPEDQAQVVTRRKSKIIKLNQPKAFRYVPEELPEVELPNLATKKRAMRKRVNTYPGDDYPDLLLETKRHTGEGDLRSVLTTQRTNKLSTFTEEESSTSEPQNKVTRCISGPSSLSSPITLDAEHIRAAPTRAHSPIVATGARVTRLLTGGGHSSPIRLDSHVQSPSPSPTKSSGLAPSTGLQAQQERTFGGGMSDDLRLQSRQANVASICSSPVKATTIAATQSNYNSSAHSQPSRNFFKDHADNFSPVNKAPSSVSDHKPSIFRQCISIFAQRPNLMSRSSPGLNQFSLRHLDEPSCRPFALDHL